MRKEFLIFGIIMLMIGFILFIIASLAHNSATSNYFEASDNFYQNEYGDNWDPDKQESYAYDMLDSSKDQAFWLNFKHFAQAFIYFGVLLGALAFALPEGRRVVYYDAPAPPPPPRGPPPQRY